MSAGGQPGKEGQVAPQPSEMVQELERVLASPEFRSSTRRSRLLQYLVERAAAGDAISEYAIGLDVFGKPEDYDPRIDPGVRVEIGRIRQRLEDYYSAGGRESPVRIEIPKRSHVPILRAAAGAERVPAPGADSLVDPSAIPQRPGHSRILLATLGLFGCAAALLGTFFFTAGNPVRSVVVLPFENLTGDPANGYLADGVTEQLTDSLAQISSLRVVARTSAFQFKGKAADVRDIGRRVAADAVIEGSLRSTPAGLQVTVQVNRSSDGYHIFSQTLTASHAELGQLENQMASRVLAAILPRATLRRRRAPDPQAHDLYLKARAYRAGGTRSSFEQAVALLNEAIRRDPSYVDAYSALAGTYAAAATSFAPEPLPFAEKAQAAAKTALDLDSSCADALGVEGYLDGVIFLKWDRGESELRTALKLMPQSARLHDWLGISLLARGRFSEAVAQLRATESLDPLVAAPGAAIGLALYMARRYDDALRQFTKVRDLYPDVKPIALFLGEVWEAKGEYQKAEQEYRSALAVFPGESQAEIAGLLARENKPSEARALLTTLEHRSPGDHPVSPLDIAAVYGALGDRDAAFQWLDRAYDQRVIWPLKVHPLLDPLRSDPRFSALLRRTGL